MFLNEHSPPGAEMEKRSARPIGRPHRDASDPLAALAIGISAGQSVLLLFILPCRKVLTSFVLGAFKQTRPGNDGCGQLEANSVRIEEVNRLNRMMVGYSEDLDAGGAQLCHRGLESGDRIDPQGEMIHPWRRVG